jgi:spore germination protein
MIRGLEMMIHVVLEGETVDSIAETYGVSVERLILENELSDPYKLATGETLVVLFPEITYTIREGDTLGGIADSYAVSVMQLLRNNPYLSNREYIIPGETIVISYEGEKNITLSTYGYAYPFIDIHTLKKTLPLLTYLTIFSYRITSEGDIIDIDDIELIQLAKAYRVAPILMLTSYAETQTEEIRMNHELLIDQDKQNNFINKLIDILRTKGYYGVNINTSYILPEDRILYVEFIIEFANRISSEGFQVFNTLSLSTFELITGTIYEGIEFEKIGQAVDAAMLISYEWGYCLGIPSGIISYETLRKFLRHMSEEIPPEKIFIGIPSIGYVWKLPYEAGVSRGMSISYNSAVELAIEYGANIYFDDMTKSAYFQYVLTDEFIVRFRDARSIDAFVNLIPEFDLKGVGIWNVMIYFAQMWLVINSRCEINKIL